MEDKRPIRQQLAVVLFNTNVVVKKGFLLMFGYFLYACNDEINQVQYYGISYNVQQMPLLFMVTMNVTNSSKYHNEQRHGISANPQRI